MTFESADDTHDQHDDRDGDRRFAGEPTFFGEACDDETTLSRSSSDLDVGCMCDPADCFGNIALRARAARGSAFAKQRRVSRLATLFPVRATAALLRATAAACACASLASLLASCSSPRAETRSADAAGSASSSSMAADMPAGAHAMHAGATTSVPHGDHAPKYGGTVYMKGDLHFEVVLRPNGMHQVYFSDAVRADLPAATASELTLTVSGPSMPSERLTGHIDESGESWMAHGSPLRGDRIMARVAFVTAGEPYWIDVPYLSGAR